MPNRPESLYSQGSEKTPFRYPYLYPYKKRPIFPVVGTGEMVISPPKTQFESRFVRPDCHLW
jgi:hypothetical protein